MFELDPIYSNECGRSSSWVENNESRIIEESSFKQACNGIERGRMEFRRDAGRELQNPSLTSRWSSVTAESGNDVLILENTVKESVLKYMKYWPKGLKGRTR